MKYFECKPCEYFTTKPGGKRKSICSLHDEDKGNFPIKTIIWCKEFEDKNKKEGE